jgi:hypothetical protein
MLNEPCCKQMCCHPGFVVPFIEKRKSRFNLIPKGTRIFKFVNEYRLQFKPKMANY